MEAAFTRSGESGLESRRFLSRLALAVLLVLLATSPSWKLPQAGPASLGSVHAAVGSNPVIDAGGCTYVPDTSDPRTFACGEDNNGLQYAYVGAPVLLDLEVSSPDGSAITVTVWWDTQLKPGVFPWELLLANASAVQSFDVTPTGPNQPVHIHTEWTYWALSTDDIVSGRSSYYNVSVNASNAGGYDPFSLAGCSSLPYGNCWFRLAVALNSPPSLNGLQASYTYLIPPPNPIIPAFSLEVSVQDADNDPVVVTWEWDDGSVTVNGTGPAALRIHLNVTHAYTFPLNVTPRNIYYHVKVSVDDGIPTHNTTTEALIYYYLGYDGMPGRMSFSSPHIGSIWETNTNVPIETFVEEPEGEQMTYYWDFGDGNLSPRNTMHNGTASTSHAYPEPGTYNITFWATDGIDKELCLNLDANCTVTLLHWANYSVPILVRLNRAPIISLTISSDPGVHGKEAGFAVAAYDKDSDNLTITWSFGDGTWAVNLTEGSSTNVQVTQVHNYTHWGTPPNYTFPVIVWVDDGQGHNVSESTEIFIGSQNMPPLVSAVLLLANNTVRANDTFALNITVSDPEGDPVWIHVAFGDGDSWNGTNDTMVPGANYTFLLTHSYTTIGNYTINITVSDHMIWVRRNGTTGGLLQLPHNVSTAAIVEVQAAAPQPVSADWTWIDYTTLAAVLALPAAGAVRVGYRRYLERKEE